VTVYEIAVQLQQDLIESSEKPTRVRKSAESKFIQKVLGAFGYESSRQKLQIKIIPIATSNISDPNMFISFRSEQRRSRCATQKRDVDVRDSMSAFVAAP
jgi:hypothetical protein